MVDMSDRKRDATRRPRSRSVRSFAVLARHPSSASRLAANVWTVSARPAVAGSASTSGSSAAKKAGANDAIFVDEVDTVNEATAGNVFVVTDGRLRTPLKSTRILPGVTRDKLLVAARAAGIGTAEERITKSELLSAQEVFLSSTTAEVTPVATVDGKQIGGGKPGPVSRRVFEQFARMFIRK